MLAKNLRYLRKQKGYSQDYIADYLGYKSYTTIQKWEMGASQPPIGKLSRLCELYKIDLTQLNITDLEIASNSGHSSTPATVSEFLLTPKEERILYNFKQLNDIGQKKALDNIHDLTLVPLYRNDPQPAAPFILNAAHEIPNSSIEDQQYDEDIMDDDNF